MQSDNRVAGRDHDRGTEGEAGERAPRPQRSDGQAEAEEREGRLEADRRADQKPGEQTRSQVQAPEREDGEQAKDHAEYVIVAARHDREQHQRIDGPEQVSPRPPCRVGAEEPIQRQGNREERERVLDLEPENRPAGGVARQQRCSSLAGRGQRAVRRADAPPFVRRILRYRIASVLELTRCHGVRAVAQRGDPAVDGVVAHVA